MLFFLTFISLIKEKCFQKILSSTTLILNHNIRMISKGSCDTEDWSNDAEISSLLYRNTF